MKICIDPGHNDHGVDTGAIGSKSREQDISFAIASKLKDILVSNGFEVKMTREKQSDCLGTSLNSSLAQRAKISNDFGAEYFISIHCNAASSKEAKLQVEIAYLKYMASRLIEKDKNQNHTCRNFSSNNRNTGIHLSGFTQAGS